MNYPKTATNQVNRLKQRGAYDTDTIHNIVQTSDIVHVSFPTGNQDDYPVILPMIGVLASFDNPSASLSDPMDLYLHGWVSARIMRLANDPTKPLKVCVCAAKTDGLILALTPFHHSYNYRSAVLFGTAEVVVDKEEKVWAMEKVTDKVVAGRWANSRTPPLESELTSTTILKITIDSASAKVRVGGPGDDAKDTEDENVIGKVWTGIIPVYESYGEPIPSNYNQVEEVPEYITTYIKERNEREKGIALENAKKEKK